MSLSSKDLIKLLEQKHVKDVFVPECKNGASQTTSGHRRMDAWAMRRSWANPIVWAYEVKVSRSDFLGDNKWHEYLDCCNELYFVTPHGLISPEEIPADAGLMWASKTGGKLYVKKKAPTRREPIREDVFRYILMCRTTVDRPYTGVTNRQYWDQWLANQAIDAEFGRRVSRAIAKKLQTEINLVKQDNKRLSDQNNLLAHLRERLKEIGIDEQRYISTCSIDRRIEELQQKVPKEIKQSLKTLLRDLPMFAKQIGVD